MNARKSLDKVIQNEILQEILRIKDEIIFTEKLFYSGSKFTTEEDIKAAYQKIQSLYNKYNKLIINGFHH